MRFDRSGGHAPPAAQYLFPGSAGRSVRLFRFRLQARPELDRGHVAQARVDPEVVVPVDVARQLDLQLAGRG